MADEASNLGRRTLSAMAWTYGGAVGRVLAQLVVQLLLARFLGPEAFGQATAALLIHSFGWILAEAGFGASLIQKEKIDDDDIRYALGWVLLISVAFAVAVVVLANLLAVLLGNPELRWLIAACGALIPIQALSSIPSSLMRRRLDARRTQLIYLASYLVSYVGLALPLAATGAGPWALVAAFAAQSLFGLVASYAVVRHPLRPKLSGDASLRKFGLQVTAANCGNWATENLDRVLISRLWGSAPLGAYAAAFTLSRAPAGFLLGSLQPIAFAAASRIQNDREKLAQIFMGVSGLAALVSWPLFGWMGAHAQALIHLLYGNKWDQAAPLLQAFCAGLPFIALMTLTGPMLWAVKAVRHDTVAQGLSVVVLLVGLPLLSGWSLATAVWLIPCTYFLRSAWMLLALQRQLYFRLSTLLRALCGGTLLGMLSLAVSLACAHAVPAYGGLAAALLSGALVAVIAFLLLRWGTNALLGPALLSQLEALAQTSAPIRRVCQWLGVLQ